VTRNTVKNCFFGVDADSQPGAVTHHSIVIGGATSLPDGSALFTFMQNSFTSHYPWQNDFHTFEKCAGGFARHSVIYSPNTTGQGKQHYFKQCLFEVGGRVNASDSLYGSYYFSGSYVWEGGGFFGTRSWQHWMVQPTETIVFKNVQSEGCARFLRTNQYTLPHSIIIEGGRHSITSLASDGVWITMNSFGPLQMRGYLIDPVFVPGVSDNFKIQMNSAASSVPNVSSAVVLDSCVLPNANPVVTSSLKAIGITMTRCKTTDTSSNTIDIPDRIANCGENTLDLTTANVVDGKGVVDVYQFGAVPFNLTTRPLNTVVGNARTFKMVGWRDQNKTVVWPNDEKIREIRDLTYGPNGFTITHKTSDANSAGIQITQGSTDRWQVDDRPFPEVHRLANPQSVDSPRPDAIGTQFWYPGTHLGVAAFGALPNPVPDASGLANNGTRIGATNTTALTTTVGFPAGVSADAFCPAMLFGGPDAAIQLPVLTIPQPFAVAFLIGPFAAQVRHIFTAAAVDIFYDGAHLALNAGTLLTGPAITPGFIANFSWCVVYVNGGASSISVNRLAAVVGNAGAGGIVAETPYVAALASAPTNPDHMWYGFLDDVCLVSAPSATQLAQLAKYGQVKWGF
jgi:hypothetical protein